MIPTLKTRFITGGSRGVCQLTTPNETQKRPASTSRASLYSRINQRSQLGHQNCVNYVNHTVRLIYIGNRNRRCTTFGIGQYYFLAFYHGR